MVAMLSPGNPPQALATIPRGGRFQRHAGLVRRSLVDLPGPPRWDHNSTEGDR
ncbi:MAG: hypothetical protein KIT69_04210 [Propionibacteriaceae bacterium]|nr:hypothetical protein [Propionibacteriaceae bacterium]